jgi:mRNA interferase HigB
MWVITRRRLRQYWIRHPDTEGWLKNWYQVASRAEWKDLDDVRAAFPHADAVKVGSGRSVTVFNVRGNHHRMITAIHYNTEEVLILALMTHAQYSRNRWKEEL